MTSKQNQEREDKMFGGISSKDKKKKAENGLLKVWGPELKGLKADQYPGFREPMAKDHGEAKPWRREPRKLSM